MNNPPEQLSVAVSLENLEIIIEGLGSMPASRAGFLYASLVQGRDQHIAKMNAPASESSELRPTMAPGQELM